MFHFLTGKGGVSGVQKVIAKVTGHSPVADIVCILRSDVTVGMLGQTEIGHRVKGVVPFPLVDDKDFWIVPILEVEVRFGLQQSADESQRCNCDLIL